MTIAALALLLSALPASAIAEQRSSRPLLDVPYVVQTPELCGGAAVAMVLRYWGERQVFPEDFQSLVNPAERGIPTSSLEAAVRRRGWQTLVVETGQGDARRPIQQRISRGQPLIALIEVLPRTYHYVVIVAATEGEVVIHDPARSPFRVLSWQTFDRAWAEAGRWMMLILPPEATADTMKPAVPDRTSGARSTAAKSPCDALVDSGVELALSDGGENAEQALVGASRVCPFHAGAWRELAGWRFSQRRWAEASEAASRAVRLSPEDAHARELLASSRYLDGDVLGALDAWAPAGEPRIDAIAVHGAERTPHPLVVDAMDLAPRQVLTSELFLRALRRLRALPVASGARIEYEPLEGGLARIDASIVERDPYPKGWLTFAVLGGRAAIGREARAEAAGLFSAAERLSLSGRWREERPRIALGVSAPSPFALPGITAFEAMWERQSYPGIRETRRRVSVHIEDWATSWLRWKAGLAGDRFDDHRYLALDAGLDLRAWRDRLAALTAHSRWLPAGGAKAFANTSVRLAWRSTDDIARGTWSLMSAVDDASQSAPLAIWEGAGTGSARAGLLRAHSLLDDHTLNGPVFGRRIARGTVEYSHPVGRTVLGNVSVAAFIDAARAWRRMEAGASGFLVDAGAGLRVRLPGRSDGVRIDIAHGLRAGGARASVGWLNAWPQ